MPSVSLVIVGTGEWERYTLPFIASIMAYTDFHIVCVDNGAQYPDIAGVQMVRLPKIVSYAEALNAGIRAFRADWYFICNNDMQIEKSLHCDRFSTLDTNSLYSWIMVDSGVVGFEYLESFSMFIPDAIWQKVGEFDENFKPMWFEGADYCYRAQKSGFRLAPPLDRNDWGVYHLEEERMGERRKYMHEHLKERQANRKYLQRKHGIRVP